MTNRINVYWPLNVVVVVVVGALHKRTTFFYVFHCYLLYNFKFLSLTGALRFCRKIVGLKEEVYNKYIIKENCFRPIVDAFLANGDRYNLINSAMIELFEFIKVVSTT